MIRGAGVLIAEFYHGQIVIILFGKNNKNYNDLGGHVESGETPAQTASRESREESNNLFNLTPKQLLKYSIPVRVQDYATYILYVRKINPRDYTHNVGIVHENCQSKVWKETDSLIRIPLLNIISSATQFVNYAYDMDDNVVHVNTRTMDIVRETSPILLNLIHAEPIVLQKYLVEQSRMPCLIGTYSYEIVPLSLPRTPGPISYALCLGPDLNSHIDPFLLYCNPKTKGMHIALTGFHPNQPISQKLLRQISRSESKRWTMNTRTIRPKENIIYFRSRTLDRLSELLFENQFHKVRGPIYSQIPWLINSQCRTPKNIKSILKDQLWSLILVSMQDGKIQWLNHYPF
jgi:hypothetical protein